MNSLNEGLLIHETLHGPTRKMDGDCYGPLKIGGPSENITRAIQRRIFGTVGCALP